MRWLDTLLMSLSAIRANKLRSFLTLVGIVLLLLSYFGSKLVLENILGKSWQS